MTTPSHPAPVTVTLSPVQELALRRIQELENRIANGFGLRLWSGIELEFYYRDKDGGVPQDRISPTRYAPARPIHKKDIDYYHDNFARSPVVQQFKTEMGTQKYEIVVGRSLLHNYPGDDISQFDKWHFDRAAPSVIARSAHIIRQRVEQRTPELEDGNQARFWAIDPAVERKKSSAGLHVNLSLWNPETGENLMEGSTNLSRSLLQGSLEVQRHLFPLIVHSSHSLDRFGRGTYVPKEIRAGSDKCGNTIHHVDSSNHTEMNNDESRFEYRIAGADVDPILATLYALGGLYYGLKYNTERVTVSKGESVAGGANKTLIHQSDAAYVLKPLITTAEKLPNYTIPMDADTYGKSLDRFAESDISKEVLGEELHHALVTQRRMEAKTLFSHAPVGMGR